MDKNKFKKCKELNPLLKKEMFLFLFQIDQVDFIKGIEAGFHGGIF